ncbi:hypothetical protein [Verrucomicrobium spinosum]|uniref:hypothetical protein n=1 Tax=Verrucomicrobium spinosum TaxID=2736 RepID=UPI000946300E|nr:hypothetical protein [Verrucomicrobium spinosum]
MIKFKPLSQEIMDTEIGYAIHAGIDYWAFDWYPPGSGMELARNFYLTSAKRQGLKWCVVLGTNPFDMNRDAPWLAAGFAKPEYQKVLDGRPLVYLFTPIARKDLAVLRDLSMKSCGKSPYVAMMGWTAAEAAQACETVGADAVSMYAGGMEKSWSDYSKLKEIIPNVGTGWIPPFFGTLTSLGILAKTLRRTLSAGQRHPSNWLPVWSLSLSGPVPIRAKFPPIPSWCTRGMNTPKVVGFAQHSPPKGRTPKGSTRFTKG